MQKPLRSELGFTPLTTPESLRSVREIADEIWPETFQSILSAEQIAYMMEMMYSPAVMADELARGVAFILVRADGENAGYLSWSPCPEDPQTAKLHKVYLRSRWHRRGIGSAMLQYMIGICRDRGFGALKLNVNKRNTPAIRAYERNGFRIVDQVCLDIGGGFVMDDYVMQIRLK